LATFVAKLPKWVGPDGFPLSWRHWIYGVAWLGREHSRAIAAEAQAFRIGQANQDDYDAFTRDVEMTTGVPRNV
jgi:spore cortex formation protein SpoVR/YcgB (stage V sporulation)